MKIAQVSATFPPYMAGTGNVCYHYAIELAKLGHEVTVFTSKYPDEDYTYPDIITVKRFKPLFRIGNGPFIPQLLREIKDFDIVHLHYPFFFGGEMIYLLKKLRNQKYVITYHNDVIFKGHLNLLLKIYKSTMMKEIFINASKIIVHSLDHGRNSDINEIVKRRTNDVIEVPNGVDITKFNPKINGNEIKSKYNIEDKNVVLFVGALDKAHYFKGVEYLLYSFAKIKSKDTYLIIVGEGELKKYYIALSKKLKINQNTIFAGKVSDNDLPKYYAAADVVVLPSIAIECFGIVLIEGMATGKPVVATNLPGVRTVVDDGINGFLVNPMDTEALSLKIQYLLENEKIRKKFGQNGRKKVEKKYSWKKIALKLEKVYISI